MTGFRTLTSRPIRLTRHMLEAFFPTCRGKPLVLSTGAAEMPLREELEGVRALGVFIGQVKGKKGEKIRKEKRFVFNYIKFR